MSDQDEQPKQEIGEYTSGGYYTVRDLLVIMKGRSKHLRYHFEIERPPFDIPTWLQRAEAEGEMITDKQRRKLLRRYGHEWNVFLAGYTKPAEPPEFISYYGRN